MDKRRSIVILDFGGQYAHLIASRVRRLGVYSEIREAETSADDLKDAAGIILSGGPASVYDKDATQGDPDILKMGVPVLGICYGHQWIAHVLHGKVEPGITKEYGRSEVEVVDKESFLGSVSSPRYVAWMSHGDEVKELPKGFKQVLRSDTCEIAGMEDTEKRIYGIQFHPEVRHTGEDGRNILTRFVEACDADPWSVKSYASQIEEEIKETVGDRKVFMLVSGGVDSTVAFTLLDKVLGPERVQGLLVDTGLMRKDEVSQIQEALKDLGLPNLRVEDASEEFFTNLKDVYGPEEKRKIIGDTFLAVQKRVSEEMGLTVENGWMLGQGTIYPDTIETGGTKHADQIKTHHNRVESVQKMIDQGLVIEPLKDLYKDEVRELGEELGLPHDLVWRHPFPGPGLGVRILCGREPESGIRNQESGKLLPVKSVGVQGDGRTYRHAIAFFSEQPCEVSQELWKQSTDIPNKDPQINRVLKCTSHSKPVEFVFTPGYIIRDRADLLREADAIVSEEMHRARLYEKIWQFPVVLLPFGKSKGGQSIVLRPIESTDAMTANGVHLPEDVLKKMTEQILSLDGIDLVFLDLTSKPPATIEWE
ncbi:MAG: glutamine-hydrolyzing GMP synthase [Patescibacteria group bacterium]